LPACFSSSQLAYYAGERSADAPALGSVTLVSGKAGNLTFAPNHCYAGDERQFLGGDFVDEKAGMSLRFVIDPLYGPAARVFSIGNPDEQTVVFRRSDCATFQFQIERTGLSINDVDEYRISLELDCATDGETLNAKVATGSCL
jgi:hypothetical protein